MSAPTPHPERAGTLLRLLALAAAVILTASAGPAVQAALVLALLLYGAATASPGLRPLARFRFWVFLTVPALCAGLYLGLPAGLRLSLRALCLVLACGVLLSPLTLSRLTGVSSSPGWKGFAFALGVGQNMLATLSRSCATTWQTVRLRGGFRRRPARMLRRFLVTVGYGTVRHGEEIVQAAAARAFDLERKGVEP